MQALVNICHEPIYGRTFRQAFERYFEGDQWLLRYETASIGALQKSDKIPLDMFCEQGILKTPPHPKFASHSCDTKALMTTIKGKFRAFEQMPDNESKKLTLSIVQLLMVIPAASHASGEKIKTLDKSQSVLEQSKRPLPLQESSRAQNGGASNTSKSSQALKKARVI
jgi:hypothetical protein